VLGLGAFAMHTLVGGTLARASDPAGFAESPRARSRFAVELETAALGVFPVRSDAGRPLLAQYTTMAGDDVAWQLGGRLLYSLPRDVAIGLMAFVTPAALTRRRSDSVYPAFVRIHSRDYLVVGAEGRYTFARASWGHVWVGVSAGGVIVADRYTSPEAPRVPPLVATGEVAARTEGAFVGAQVGAFRAVSKTFSLGVTAGAQRWWLPESSHCGAFGDCATLTGPVHALNAGLSLRYELAP